MTVKRFHCYECDEVAVLVWSSRCVKCVVKKLESNLAENEKLRAENEALKNGWLRVIDEALVTSHLAIANADDSYEAAKEKLNTLICFEASVREYFENESLLEKLATAIRYIEENPNGCVFVGDRITDGAGLVEFLESNAEQEPPT